MTSKPDSHHTASGGTTPLIIGVDFDNTIVGYNELFYRCARERHLIPDNVPISKAAVRAHLKSQPDGNTPWTALQGVVYGERMQEAAPCPGVMEFFMFCVGVGIRIEIISHKQEYPALGPRVNLRQSALQWIEAHGLYTEEQGGLHRGNVYFGATRAEKIDIIRTSSCTHFVDDLPEVFADIDFPSRVQKILYAADPHTEALRPADVVALPDWLAITDYFRQSLALL